MSKPKKLFDFYPATFPTKQGSGMGRQINVKRKGTEVGRKGKRWHRMETGAEFYWAGSYT